MALVVDLDVVERRLDAGDTMIAIAADLDVTPRTIRNRLPAAGRPLAKDRHRRQRGRVRDPAWLRHQYVELARSPSSIAESLSVSTDDVTAALESLGVERPPVRPELTGLALRSAFASSQTVASIARTAGVDRATVRREMRRPLPLRW